MFVLGNLKKRHRKWEGKTKSGKSRCQSPLKPIRMCRLIPLQRHLHWNECCRQQETEYLSAFGSKSCSGSATMSLKTTSQLPLTSNYSLDLRHQNHNLPLFFFHKPFFNVAERVRKSREYNFGSMKNKKRTFPARIQTS